MLNEHNIHELKDFLAGIVSDLDQAQALLDEARATHPHDKQFQSQLDLHQTWINLERLNIQHMRTVFEILES